jgi:hypothetical protein
MSFNRGVHHVRVRGFVIRWSRNFQECIFRFGLLVDAVDVSNKDYELEAQGLSFLYSEVVAVKNKFMRM